VISVFHEKFWVGEVLRGWRGGREVPGGLRDFSNWEVRENWRFESRYERYPEVKRKSSMLILPASRGLS
jgi:hypothetical protein